MGRISIYLSLVFLMSNLIYFLFYMCCYLLLLLIGYLIVFSLVQLIAKKSLLYLLLGLFDKSIFQL